MDGPEPPPFDTSGRTVLNAIWYKTVAQINNPVLPHNFLPARDVIENPIAPYTANVHFLGILADMLA
jgi:hypothetical protein